MKGTLLSTIIFFSLCLYFFTACTTQIPASSKGCDTVYLAAPVVSTPIRVVSVNRSSDSLIIARLLYSLDSVNNVCVVFKHKQDSLRTSLLLANSKVIKVKKYVRIVQANPKQMKQYFFGWIRVVVGL